MIPAQLQSCERELRKAIARRQYDDVADRMDELRRVADQSLQTMTDRAERQEIAGWILATIEWARLMIVTQRQNRAEELDQIPRVDRFLEGAGVVSQEVCLDL